MFNEKEEWTYKDLADRTKIPKKNLEASLVSACNPKVKILSKEVNAPKFDKPDEKIRVNLDFKNPNLMVKIIPQGAAKKIDGSE